MSTVSTEEMVEVEEKLQEPKQCQVVLLNDDVTTFDFVVFVLQTVFYKDAFESKALTLTVHEEGQGIAGVYPIEIAESKCHETMEIAKCNGFPLKVITEEVNM